MSTRYRTRFRALITVQVLLLVASISLLTYSFLATEWLAVPMLIAGLVVLQTIGLLRCVEVHVDTLDAFFSAIDHEDFTCRYVEDDLDAELKGAFNRISGKFQRARAERDLQANYLQTVVQHVPIPFMAVRSDGHVSLVNNAARQLSGLAHLQHIDELATVAPDLPRHLRAIEPKQRQLLQTTLRNIPVELRVSVSEIRLQKQTERLYSIENLSGELSARESSAWRNLIRVLTHEIMNTLTPVTSLAHSCNDLINEAGASDEIQEAMQTIARRSERLTEFVSNYRELLQLPQPTIQRFALLEVCENLSVLMRDELEDITLSIVIVPPTLELEADQNLLDQVLLNLIRNAVDALRNISNPAIELSARLSYGRTLITVKDNGPGIPGDVVEQIFVPFFTTKRNGSGIGLSLSLSRQIMTAHGGEIAVASDAGGTLVTLVF